MSDLKQNEKASVPPEEIEERADVGGTIGAGDPAREPDRGRGVTGMAPGERPHDGSREGGVGRLAEAMSGAAGAIGGTLAGAVDRLTHPTARADLKRLEALAANRVAIERVTPSVDGGRFPAKVITGRPVTVEADVFCDGHDKIAASAMVRRRGETEWTEYPMRHVDNDRWRATAAVGKPGMHELQIHAWRDLWAYWQYEVGKKRDANVSIELEMREGRALVETALKEGDPSEADRAFLTDLLTAFDRPDAAKDGGTALPVLLGTRAHEAMRRVAPRTNLSRLDEPLPLWVDRERALYSAWYELFPRSWGPDGKHGTFKDVEKRLDYVADLGFDVLYFPPVHPIGLTNRKGKNNTLTPGPDDVGVPYAIGSEDGGHDAVHPELGTLEDFEHLVEAARGKGLEVAIDFAIQCSPDHPWIKEHPEWFDWRPDGSIRYAENPPKKYEDIVNVHFYRDAKPALWLELLRVVRFWIERGVLIFRVDNPHTKPYPFWEWLIGEIHRDHPDAIFLAEAFTRPKVMKRLAKCGFNQSYSYFTWRNEKWEIEQYMRELTGQLPGWEDMPDVMRANFFVNTPDINPGYLQTGGRAAHRVRLVLAATLNTNYGVYNGFEVCDARPMPGKEEYLDSEKYQLRQWDFDAPGHIKDDIRLMNRLRREHECLRQFRGLRFYEAHNENVILYGRMTDDLASFVLVAVSLDPHNAQGADIEVPLWEFGLPDNARIDAIDLVTGAPFTWEGKWQNVYLTPNDRPYAMWRLMGPARNA